MDDEARIRRCIDLARQAVSEGNHPFGALIIQNEQIVAEGINRVVVDRDPVAHAETVAIRVACQTLDRRDLADCVLYTSCEPCWLCGYAIRKSAIQRVVFAAYSPGLGSYSSSYPILTSHPLVDFGPPPAITAGLLAAESDALFAELGWIPR